MFNQPKLSDTKVAISSPESVDGPSLYNSPDGQLSLFPCGPAPAHVSPSRRRGSGKAKPTSGTCGLSSSGSSASASLQSSLASKLQAMMGCDGLMECSLTWKERVTPEGRRICALRASARRTSASDCSGWPTPKVASGDYQYSSKDHSKISLNLSGAVKLVGWPTPTARDHKDQAENNAQIGSRLGRRVWLSNAETERPAGLALNPAFSRWLMGYPEAWDNASPEWQAWCEVQAEIEQDASGDMETPSSPK